MSTLASAWSSFCAALGRGRRDGGCAHRTCAALLALLLGAVLMAPFSTAIAAPGEPDSLDDELDEVESEFEDLSDSPYCFELAERLAPPPGQFPENSVLNANHFDAAGISTARSSWRTGAGGRIERVDVYSARAGLSEFLFLYSDSGAWSGAEERVGGKVVSRYTIERDVRGRLAAQTCLSASGAAFGRLAYHLDDWGRILSVGDGGIPDERAYDSAGRWAYTLHPGNGMLIAVGAVEDPIIADLRTYDASGRLDRIDSVRVGGSIGVRREYTWGNDGNLISQTTKELPAGKVLGVTRYSYQVPEVSTRVVATPLLSAGASSMTLPGTSGVACNGRATPANAKAAFTCPGYDVLAFDLRDAAPGAQWEELLRIPLRAVATETQADTDRTIVNTAVYAAANGRRLPAWQAVIVPRAGGSSSAAVFVPIPELRRFAVCLAPVASDCADRLSDLIAQHGILDGE